MSGANASATARSHQVMSGADAIIFKDLPATFPEEDKFKKPSFLGSLGFHAVLIGAVVSIPLLIPPAISERELLLTLVAPIGPPPGPPPSPAPMPVAASVPPKVAKPLDRPVAADVLVMPTTIPTEVAKIVEAPEIIATDGVIGGVPGGVPGGVAFGILGSILSANSNANAPPAIAPPPPQPPPPPTVAAPAEPVRVGGIVKEPRVLKLVPPVYPKLASVARVSGTVVLEAIVTADGTVSEIRVVSGHTLLVDAAVNCVKQWLYEPTMLNGVPIPVILTARVHFERAIS